MPLDLENPSAHDPALSREHAAGVKRETASPAERALAPEGDAPMQSANASADDGTYVGQGGGYMGGSLPAVESGVAEVYKTGEDGCVMTYKKGDYFGELALLNDAPRAASVIAKTDVTAAILGREPFSRLLGSLEGIMRRNDYSKHADVDPLDKS